MKKQLLLSSILLSLTLLISACASTQVSQPLASNTRIGVYATLPDQAQIYHVGISVLGDSQTKTSLPNLSPNQLFVQQRSKH